MVKLMQMDCNLLYNRQLVSVWPNRGSTANPTFFYSELDANRGTAYTADWQRKKVGAQIFSSEVSPAGI